MKINATTFLAYVLLIQSTIIAALLCSAELLETVAATIVTLTTG
ncbi:hypothetical protein [Vibrio ziniensis]|nr:hypothetical protein [Vibrio ziniensis]